MTRRDLTPAEILRRVHDIKRAGLDSDRFGYSETSNKLSYVLNMLDNLADDLTYGITDSTEATDND